MQQKLVQNFFTTRSWRFWKQGRNGAVKTTLKIEKCVCCIFTENICSARNPVQVVVFLQTCINFVKQRPSLLS